MTTFLRYLVRQLDLETPDWRESSTILLDNASWHTNPEIKQRLAKMDLPICWSGPYAYSSASIEMMFSFLKLGDLNPARLPTGKR